MRVNLSLSSTFIFFFIFFTLFLCSSFYFICNIKQMLTHYSIIFNFNGIDIFIFLLKNYIKVEAFWPPLPNSGTVCRSFVEESCFGFW